MQSTSVFDLFKIGIGPSSSHTVGPMIAAKQFAETLKESNQLEATDAVFVELFGSLGATGRGHGSDKAVILGLTGEDPKTTNPDETDSYYTKIIEQEALNILREKKVIFKHRTHLILHKRKSLPYHPNGMRFKATDAYGHTLLERVYYSVGGGFVVDQDAVRGDNPLKQDDVKVPYPFSSGSELLEICLQNNLLISDVLLANEKTRRPEELIRKELLIIWKAMQECVRNGYKKDGVLPGGLKVRRRAPALYRSLTNNTKTLSSPLGSMDWVNLYALAVNEENASGGRVVTAPTNGAAGIVPAVMHYYWHHCEDANEDGIVRFLLTAGAVGLLFKLNASISGAEVGCQGEVGSACSMAAAGLTEVLGGSPEQVENAAEIGIEHNLGLTCDPIGGLVQIPCIERNAMGSVKAINAAHLALHGDGKHFVSLDKAIKTMRDTGRDMKTKYKETSRGGLAINVIEVPVSLVEC